ncbi:MAG: glycosyltransferase family 4 protein [Oryzihumus sp.]
MRRTARRHVLLVVENVSLARDHRLRKQASSLQAAGYDVTVICRRDPGNVLPGVRVVDYPAPPDGRSRLSFVREYGWSWLMAAALAWRVWLTRPFGVIQVSGTPDIYFTLAAPFRLFGVTVVQDQRDLSPEVYVARYGGAGGRVHRLLVACERTSFRLADRVVTVNETLRDVVTGRGGLPEENVTVVGNGPRLERVAPPRAPRPTGAVCCWVGLMGPQDRLDLLVEALALVVHERGRTDVRAVLIGDGESRPDTEALVERLGLRGHVELTGWLDEAEVFAHLAAADVGLEPNMGPEVSPVKVMEYMASGLPFVAFDLRETRALGGDGGRYATPGDVAGFAEAIHELTRDPGLRARLGAAGQQRVREHVAWEHQEAAYLRLFADLLPLRPTGVEVPA